MAEALLRRHLADLGIGVELAEVGSCGLLDAGSPAPEEVVEVLAELGEDITAHRSRRLSPQVLEEADLVLTMTREHVREAVMTLPEAFPRVFTLKELVRRGEETGGRGGRPLGQWLAEVAEGRRTSDLLGASADDDVADPIGGPLGGYRQTASEISGLCRRLAVLLAS